MADRTEGPEPSPFLNAVGYIGDRVTQALSTLEPETVSRVVALLDSAPKIFTYGAGRSGIIARAFAMRLVQTGLTAFVIGESVTPIVHRGDVVVIFSNRGESQTSVQTANIVRREGAELVVITARGNSKLAHAASLLVPLPLPDDPQRMRWAPLGTLFESASLRLSDGLVAALMVRRGETEESLRRRHAIMV